MTKFTELDEVETELSMPVRLMDRDQIESYYKRSCYRFLKSPDVPTSADFKKFGYLYKNMVREYGDAETVNLLIKWVFWSYGGYWPRRRGEPQPVNNVGFWNKDSRVREWRRGEIVKLKSQASKEEAEIKNELDKEKMSQSGETPEEYWYRQALEGILKGGNA